MIWLQHNLILYYYILEPPFRATSPASCKTCMHVKKQQLELDMEQQTGSKLGKEYVSLLI